MVVVDINPTYDSWPDLWESNAGNLRYVLSHSNLFQMEKWKLCLCY